MAARTVGYALERLEERKLLSGALPHAGAAGLVYDAAGVLHVAYYDTVAQNLKYATREADGTWSPTTTVDGGIGAGVQLSLALDSHGVPGVAYYDAAQKDLKYARLSGSKWAVATVDLERRVGRTPSIAFDSADHPMISYYAGGPQDLRLAAFSGRRWSVQTIDAVGGVGQFSSLAINPADGTWSIAYESATTRQVKYATRRKRTFSIGVIDTLADAANWSSKPSIAFDADDLPAVSYGDPANDAINLARAGRKRWNISAAATGGGVGLDNTLSFDLQGGLPRIVCLDQSGGVNLAISDGSAWSVHSIGAATAAETAQSAVTHLFSFLNGDDVSDLNLAINAPTDVLASISFDDPTWMNLHWTDNSMGETGFRIERSDDGVNFTTIDVLPAGTTDYDDASVALDHTYHYRVTPFDAMADGLTSAIAAATSAAAGPINLHAVAVDAGRIDLTWTNISTTAEWIEIHCTDGNGLFTVDADVDPHATSYSVTQLSGGLPLTPGTAYSFWLVVQRADGNDGLSSGDATATTDFGAPGDLLAPAETENQIMLTWGDVLGESGYELQWSTDNSNFTQLALTGADVTTYTVSGLTENSTYYFRVRALSDSGDSAFGATLMNSTLLATPTNVIAMALPGGQFQLTWDDVSNAETNYVVEIAQEAGAWTLPITLPAESNSYLITDGPYGVPQAGLQFRFSVRSLIFAGGASSRGISAAVTALA
jgi:hypothetical protein